MSKPASIQNGLSAVYFRWGERPDLMAQAWRLRYEGLVAGRGWGLPAIRELEIDRFDADALHCAVSSGARVVGYARANPTDGPHLLQEAFGFLLPEGAAPCAPDVHEVSRLVIDRSFRPQSAVLARLIDSAIAMGPLLGAERLVAVVEPWLERAVAKRGHAPVRLGEPVQVGTERGRPVYALVAEVRVGVPVASRAA
jgi:acyl homoserine lactone synthase